MKCNPENRLLPPSSTKTPLIPVKADTKDMSPDATPKHQVVMVYFEFPAALPHPSVANTW